MHSLGVTEPGDECSICGGRESVLSQTTHSGAVKTLKLAFNCWSEL